MESRIFLDASFLVALFFNSDTHHHRAVEIFYSSANKEKIISKLVIAETITVLRTKLEIGQLREIYSNLKFNCTVIDDSGLYDQAMNIFIKYDANISFFDAMYIKIMNETGLNEIASFDSDFDNKGIVRIF
ncbi:MAG: type II toxin-antitoxin system VapC family toxin [Methanobacteriaceae archaeon]